MFSAEEPYKKLEIMFYDEWTEALDKELERLSEQYDMYVGMMENDNIAQEDRDWYADRLAYLDESLERYSHIRRTAMIEKDYAIFYREDSILGWSQAHSGERDKVYSAERDRRKMIV